MEIVHSQLLPQQLLEVFLDHFLILQVIVQQSQSLLQLPQLLAVEARLSLQPLLQLTPPTTTAPARR